MSQECLVFKRVILITERIISSIDYINYILGTTCLHPITPFPPQGRLNSRNWSWGRGEGPGDANANRQNGENTELGATKFVFLLWYLFLLCYFDNQEKGLIQCIWRTVEFAVTPWILTGTGIKRKGSIRKTASHLLPHSYWSSASLPSHLLIYFHYSQLLPSLPKRWRKSSDHLKLYSLGVFSHIFYFQNI